MRYLLVLFMLASSVAFADVYVLYDKNTNEVHSLSNQDDAYGGVIPKEYKKEIIKGDLNDFDFTYPTEWYTFKNGKFKLDMKKVEEQSKIEEESRKQIERQQKIKERSDKIAEQQLIDEGILEVE